MIVSWNWLKEFLPLKISPEVAAERLMMAGHNLESIKPCGDDFAIDLEITSNRPDCLGHVGIARELAVLLGESLPLAEPKIKEGPAAIASLTSVSVECPQLCPRYTARVIRGATIQPSPPWLVKRLATLGQPTINNVVDITNYVLMEWGQPLHAFDFAKLRERRIIVREAKQGEIFLAINHKSYPLDAGMCVIADAQGPVALGGIMGGANTEVDHSTRDILIEAADFEPLAIRSTARRLALRSDSSYRFERGVDLHGIDRASRRCCEWILELAGGELAAGSLDLGAQTSPKTSITLRFAQLQRILGIEVPEGEVRRILAALGNRETSASPSQITVTPPSWRRDLEREIDLVEEVARIHGYDKIPEDARVPMAPSHRSDFDRCHEKLRHALAAQGYDEAYTVSLTPPDWADLFSPWTDRPPLATRVPMLQGADRLRRSLAPSLLAAKRTNEALGNRDCELFETAKVYLPTENSLPEEPWMLGIASSGDFHHLQGSVATLLNALNRSAEWAVIPFYHSFFEPGKSCALQIAGETLGYLGEVSAAARKKFDLRGRATIAEIRLERLFSHAVLTPQHRPTSDYPAIEFDLNLIVEEPLPWANLAQTVRRSGGQWLERLAYRETYRDPKKDGAGKKRLIFSVSLRSPERTLLGAEAEHVRTNIVEACRAEHGALLLT